MFTAGMIAAGVAEHNVAGQKAELWHVEVISISKPVQVGGEGARITVDFAYLAKPTEDFAIPA